MWEMSLFVSVQWIDIMTNEDRIYLPVERVDSMISENVE